MLVQGTQVRQDATENHPGGGKKAMRGWAQAYRCDTWCDYGEEGEDKEKQRKLTHQRRLTMLVSTMFRMINSPNLMCCLESLRTRTEERPTDNTGNDHRKCGFIHNLHENADSFKRIQESRAAAMHGAAQQLHGSQYLEREPLQEGLTGDNTLPSLDGHNSKQQEQQHRLSILWRYTKETSLWSSRWRATELNLYTLKVSLTNEV